MSKFKEHFKEYTNESKQLDEVAYKDKYDFQNLGGGWDGSSFIRYKPYGEDIMTIQLGLYSGGNKIDHKFKLPSQVMNVEWNDPEIKKIQDNIDKDISKGMLKLLKKFDSDVGKLIQSVGKKHLQ